MTRSRLEDRLHRLGVSMSLLYPDEHETAGEGRARRRFVLSIAVFEIVVGPLIVISALHNWGPDGANLPGLVFLATGCLLTVAGIGLLIMVRIGRIPPTRRQRGD